MIRLVALAILAGGAIAGASATFPLGDGDMYWHLANAKQLAERGLVRTDTYSWSAFGAPVPTDQWLGDLLYGAGYALAGWLGVTAVRTLGVAVLVGAIALAAFVRRPDRPAAALAIALPAILASRSLWTERPELLGVACFAVLVLLLQLRGDRPLIAAGVLLIAWANVHGSFALGVGLALLVATHGLWRERPRRRAYALLGAAALLALVATPAGLETLTTPGAHLLSPPREIQEWAIPDISTAPGALWLLVLVLTVATASVTGGARIRDVIVIAPVAMLSLVAIRLTPLFAIAATPYLAQRLPDAMLAVRHMVQGAAEPARREAVEPRSGEPVVEGARRTSLETRPERRVGSAALITSIAGIALFAAGIAIAPRQPDESAYPTAALASLAPGPGLLAEYDWGGWLIWHAPATPVFVDGRLTPYRGAVLDDYRAVLEAAPGWRDVIERRGVRALLVRPGDPVAVRARELGWPVLSRGTDHVLISVPHR